MSWVNNAGIYIVMLLVPLFWGGAFGVTKHVLTELPPMTTSAVRFGLAGLILLSWAVVKGGWNGRAVRQNWWGLTALGVTGVFCFNLFFAVGLQYTSAINAALVVVVNPVGTALIACLLMGEAWNRRLMTGVLLSLAGVMTVISKGDFAAAVGLQINYGEILMLGAVVSWIAYTIIGKLVMRGMGVVLVTTVSTLIGAALLAISAIPEGAWPRLTQLSGQAMAELAYLAVFPTVLAFLLYNLGIRRIGASRASAYINLMPVNAVLIAAAVYGETVTMMHLSGMVLVIGGVLLTTTSGTSKR
ncbi:MAG TPA: DMT family transporter [Patescibacteria group bacterium]|nr:DMT family transporter [Patescibacteria group bacterium]